MKEARRKQLVYLSLPLALIWGVWNFWGTSGARQPASENPQLATIAPLAPSKGVTHRKVIDTSRSDDPWGRDPFGENGRSQRTRDAQSDMGITPIGSSDWRLSGIVYDKRSPMAVLNGRTVRVGDEVNGAVVRAITKQEVRIEYKGMLKTLRVS